MKPFNNANPTCTPTSCEVEIIKLPTVELEQPRYDELLEKEERLRILETAIAGMSGYGDIDTLKKIFGIKENTDE